MPTSTMTPSQIDAFLQHPHMARLATAVPSKEEPASFQPHNVPVWFLWEDGVLYISAFQSTRKVKEVRRNPYVAVIIDLAEALDGVTAVLLEGKSELITEPAVVQEMSRRIYTRYMGEDGVQGPDPQSWIIDPENAIIRLRPARIYSW
jgi:nitroimidazol reductase NimA-like FMN-containing flavoprotein (pyridoxamine 5'-phosphate oxidase superfamily)